MAAVVNAKGAGKVGGVGYCWGSTVASATAKRLVGVAAAVGNYGRIGGLDVRGSYHAESAKQALGRTLDYFQQHIGDDAAVSGTDEK